MLHEELTGQIIGAAMKVHSTLGPGFLESVYHNAMMYELTKRGMQAERDLPLKVFTKRSKSARLKSIFLSIKQF